MNVHANFAIIFWCVFLFLLVCESLFLRARNTLIETELKRNFLWNWIGAPNVVDGFTWRDAVGVRSGIYTTWYRHIGSFSSSSSSLLWAFFSNQHRKEIASRTKLDDGLFVCVTYSSLVCPCHKCIVSLAWVHGPSDGSIHGMDKSVEHNWKIIVIWSTHRFSISAHSWNSFSWTWRIRRVRDDSLTSIRFGIQLISMHWFYVTQRVCFLFDGCLYFAGRLCFFPFFSVLALPFNHCLIRLCVSFVHSICKEAAK